MDNISVHLIADELFSRFLFKFRVEKWAQNKLMHVCAIVHVWEPVSYFSVDCQIRFSTRPLPL